MAAPASPRIGLVLGDLMATDRAAPTVLAGLLDAGVPSTDR